MQISRGVIKGAQKVVIYGPEGIGKSSFAARFSNPVFIDTEGSTKHMDVARTDKPSSWTMLLEQVKYFKANPTACDTLVIDTGDWAEQLCMTELCAKANKTGIEDFGYGKGYTYLAEEFGRLLNLLTELIDTGINVVIVAHAQMRKFEQPDEMGAYDRWEMKLQKKTAPLCKEWADMVLLANYKTYVVKTDDKKNKAQGGKRVMHTTHHPCWDAKNRHGLKDELPLDYAEIAHCIVTRGSAAPPPPVKEEPVQVEPPKPEPPAQDAEQEFQQWANQPNTTPSVEQNIPKPLADLMDANFVTTLEIQKVVASRGYYPVDTPIDNYDPTFITGVLVGAWPQVFGMIKEMRANEVPFK